VGRGASLRDAAAAYRGSRHGGWLGSLRGLLAGSSGSELDCELLMLGGDRHFDAFASDLSEARASECCGWPSSLQVQATYIVGLTWLPMISCARSGAHRAQAALRRRALRQQLHRGWVLGTREGMDACHRRGPVDTGRCAPTKDQTQKQ
jgi:hypothetical protein